MEEKPYSCEHVVPVEQEPRHQPVIENEFIRALAVEIAAHDRTLCHHHGNDYLLYVVGDAEIVSAARDEEPKPLSYRDGECELLTAGMVHVVENLKDTAFRNVVIELLSRARDLKRGAAPKYKFFPTKLDNAMNAVTPGMDEASPIRPHFESEGIAVYRFDLGPAFQVEISGPAVVATPYGTDVTFRDSGGEICNISKFNELAWILSGSGVLRSYRRGTVVVFQIGAKEKQSVTARVQHEPLKSLHVHADEPE